MKRILTPAFGTVFYAQGVTLTGGIDYIVVPEKDDFSVRQIQLKKFDILSVADKAIELPDNATTSELKAIVVEKMVSSPYDKEKDGTYQEYVKNAYLFAAEAYASMLSGKTEGDLADEAKKATSVKTTKTTV